MPIGTRFVVPVPLFSSDYAVVNREISEWNRRARPSFASIEAELNQLRTDLEALSSGSAGLATSFRFGLVKTDLTSPTPVVYLKTTVDSLVAALQTQITILSGLVASILANAAPLIHFTGFPDPNTAGIVPNPITSTLATQWCVNDDTDEKWFWNPIKMFWYS